MKKNQLILSILLVGIAFGTAWAIRGQFGHEPGAAFAGIIGVAALLLGTLFWPNARNNSFFFTNFTTNAWWNTQCQHAISSTTMKKYLFLLLVVGSLSARAIDPDPSQKLIAKGEKIIKAGGGYIFTEGPSVAPDGRVFFTDQPNDKIEVWSEGGSITTFVQGCERSNGTYFNKKGELVACADMHNRLIAFSMEKSTKILAETFNGNHLNGPNDLWIAPNGGIYFSDPYYFREYWETGHKELQDCRGVYYLSPEGKVIRVIGDYKQPNGLIGTPDGKVLYVSDINDRKIWKYSINKDGSLGSKTLFAPEGSDGMTIDNKGNVYLTNKSISVYSRKGEHIGRIEVPEQPSNLCFGGKRRNILFVTARTSVYTLRMKVRGE